MPLTRSYYKPWYCKNCLEGPIPCTLGEPYKDTHWGRMGLCINCVMERVYRDKNGEWVWPEEYRGKHSYWQSHAYLTRRRARE